MTTAQQIVDGSAQHIGVKTAEINLESDDAQLILDNLNDMLTEWADRGLTPAFTEVADLTDTVDIDRNAVAAVKSNLALLIAPSFEKIITPALAAIAATSFTRLQASTVFIGDVAYPDSLPIGSGNGCSERFNDNRFFNPNKSENF